MVIAPLTSGRKDCFAARDWLHRAGAPVIAAFVSARQFYGGMFMKTHFGFLYAFLLAISPACGKAAAFEEGRGEMLYRNHCVACHTTQVHWRDQRLAKDWASLRAQVHRWERNTGLTWSEEDIEAVSQYLNQLYYQFPELPKDKTISMFIFLRGANRGQAAAVLTQGFLAGE
jgi:hypothetical protein